MRRQRFHNAMMFILCGYSHAIPPPRRVGPAARLPTVGVDGAVQLEQPLPVLVPRRRLRLAASSGSRLLPLAAGGQQWKPNRCRQCGCEKCTATNKTYTRGHYRHEWCTQNGWERHWRADADGQGNAGMTEGPRPSKSKLQQCVRCEVEQLKCCWKRRADELQLFLRVAIYLSFVSSESCSRTAGHSRNNRQQPCANCLVLSYASVIVCCIVHVLPVFRQSHYCIVCQPFVHDVNHETLETPSICKWTFSLGNKQPVRYYAVY